jgi:transposase
MALHPQPLPQVPDATAAAVRAAFPKGNLYVDLCAEFGTLYNDQLFADLYPPEGRPVEVAPWRLALVMVMQYIEGLTDRQAADAVRRCMDWKYALSLDLTDPGFDFTLLHDFRCRLLTHEAGQRFLDAFLAACKARGWIKARGTHGPIRPMSWQRSARCTVWSVSWKPCIMRSISSVRRSPLGCSSTCRGTGIPAMASGPTKPACRKIPASARRSPSRLARTAISSWRGCRPPTHF